MNHTFQEWWLPYDANQEWWGQFEREIAFDAWHARDAEIAALREKAEALAAALEEIRECAQERECDCDPLAFPDAKNGGNHSIICARCFEGLADAALSAYQKE